MGIVKIHQDTKNDFVILIQGERDQLVALNKHNECKDYLRTSTGSILLVYKTASWVIADAISRHNNIEERINQWNNELSSFFRLMNGKLDRLICVDWRQLDSLDTRRLIRKQFPGFEIPRHLLKPIKNQSTRDICIGILLAERNSQTSALIKKINRKSINNKSEELSESDIIKQLSEFLNSNEIEYSKNHTKEMLLDQVLDLQWSLISSHQPYIERIAKIDTELKRSKAYQEELKKERDEFMWKYEAAAMALDKVYKSTSWRLTGPLRFTRKFLGRR